MIAFKKYGAKMAENEVVEVEPKEKKRKPKFFIHLEIIGPVFIT